MTLRSAAVLALALLSLAGCGSSSQPAKPSVTKQNGSVYDTVDVCGLVSDEQLQAALGEAPGDKQRRDDDSLKACAIDGVAGHFYLFLTVIRPTIDAHEQVTFDKGATPDAKPVDDATFSYANDNEAYVETSDGQLVLRASFVYYADGGSVTDAAALTARLRTLLGEMVKRA